MVPGRADQRSRFGRICGPLILNMDTHGRLAHRWLDGEHNSFLTLQG